MRSSGFVRPRTQWLLGCLAFLRDVLPVTRKLPCAKRINNRYAGAARNRLKTHAKPSVARPDRTVFAGAKPTTGLVGAAGLSPGLSKLAFSWPDRGVSGVAGDPKADPFRRFWCRPKPAQRAKKLP
ncbi:hypothetical protein [Spirosoma sp.]|uniref:hypothetical protein n=1 Tax=Spirosoma sp. TaxID=1899569 RepID=UPI001ACFA442|nr:hypothetical protein [Spirosoma sp.]MBN8820788.1 hypothetical protein [Spirosoma sp.]